MVVEFVGYTGFADAVGAFLLAVFVQARLGNIRTPLVVVRSRTDLVVEVRGKRRLVLFVSETNGGRCGFVLVRRPQDKGLRVFPLACEPKDVQNVVEELHSIDDKLDVSIHTPDDDENVVRDAVAACQSASAAPFTSKLLTEIVEVSLVEFAKYSAIAENIHKACVSILRPNVVDYELEQLVGVFTSARVTIESVEESTTTRLSKRTTVPVANWCSYIAHVDTELAAAASRLRGALRKESAAPRGSFTDVVIAVLCVTWTASASPCLAPSRHILRRPLRL